MSHGDRKGRLNVVKFLELVKKPKIITQILSCLS